jgi:hypothetical protein
VSFRYKKELDPQAVPQFGLVAEDVARVDPNLVIHDDQGRPFSVRYEEVNAMLLNEFLKEHRKGQEQDRKIQALETQMAELQAMIEKVSARIAASQGSPRLAENQ